MALLVRQDVGEVTRPTIEDVLARTEVCGEGLFTATADGPIVSADGQLVVHRTDPELAGEIRSALNRRVACGRNSDRFVTGGEARDLLRRAARLLAGGPEDES